MLEEEGGFGAVPGESGVDVLAGLIEIQDQVFIADFPGSDSWVCGGIGDFEVEGDQLTLRLFVEILSGFDFDLFTETGEGHFFLLLSSPGRVAVEFDFFPLLVGIADFLLVQKDNFPSFLSLAGE